MDIPICGVHDLISVAGDEENGAMRKKGQRGHTQMFYKGYAFLLTARGSACKGCIRDCEWNSLKWLL